MPNRILKESICISESVDRLNWFEEVLFYRLIVNCDDFGLFDGRAAVIKGRLFPLKSVTHKQIEDALNHLTTAGIVRPYIHDGKPFLQLVTWSEHQQVRAQKSKYPKPEESDFIVGNDTLQSIDSNCNQLKSDDINCSRNPIQSNTIQSESESNPNPNEINAHFETLWALFPNKKGKAKVSQKQKKALFSVAVDEFSRAVSRYLSDLKRDSWRNTQYGSTFFNGGYVDYLDANYSSSQPDKPKGRYDFDAFQRQAFNSVHRNNSKAGDGR